MRERYAEGVDWLEKQSKVEQAMREIEEKAKAFTQAHKGETSEEVLAQMRGEEKPADKVKKGKWYICTQNFVLRDKTVIIKGQTYQAEKDKAIKGENGCLFIDKHDGKASDYFRPWTIEDAKDGDVLVYCNEIFIYKDIIKTCTENDTKFGGFTYYCCYDGNLRFKSLYSLTSKDEKNIHPAIKEQCDILERAMADAGWEFDFEKKELKKVVSPKFNVHDCVIKKHNSNINNFGSFTITDITGGKYWYNDRIICDISEQDEWELYEPVRQNLLWSEEDEKNLEKTIWYVEKGCKLIFAKTDKLVPWLKSLKDRVGKFDDGYKVGFSAAKHNQWKPSDGQMESITCAVRKMKESACYDSELVSLLNDLNKLKE